MASLAKTPSYGAAKSWLQKTEQRLGTTTLQPITVNEGDIEGGNVVVHGSVMEV